MALSRRRTAPFAVLLTVLAAVTVSPQPAAAATDRYRITNKLSGKCLTIWGDGNGAAITQMTCNSADTAQWWYLDLNGTGTIRNQRIDKCLDLWDAGSANGQMVFTYGCRNDGFSGQRWRTVNKGGQYWEIRSYATDKCLDLAADNRANGAVIQQWGCNWGANDNQQWRITTS
ncbi:hypothetical protein Q0Z83_035950 [Actinoplanes sichuanensis]|uniref:RICIN domain-containing protein n=1 Tax=Actinoplanes sichuanensis TaxID=512349 RepID=A0ABW4AA65_9ACTN|nr:RICIN domain-containing protein [Actinoplanes sichuanensis]BEL05404.1 hypothetical protein Q0Z83_035950 [Actinoplanes sichuanensis]